jgi:hypothetical protein
LQCRVLQVGANPARRGAIAWCEVGKIVTADEGSTVHQALAVREGRIVALFDKLF